MRNTGGGNNCRFLDDMVSCRPPNDVVSTITHATQPTLGDLPTIGCRLHHDSTPFRPLNDVDSTASQTRTTAQPRSGRFAPFNCCIFEQHLAPWMARRPIPCPIHCHSSRSRDLSKRTYALPLRDNALVRHPSVVETSTSTVEVDRIYIGNHAVEDASFIGPVPPSQCSGVRYEHLPPHRQNALACQKQEAPRAARTGLPHGIANRRSSHPAHLRQHLQKP